MKRLLPLMLCLLALLPLESVVAQVVSVKDPWVRTTAPRQKSSSVYLEITATRTAQLLEISSPLAGTVEIHEMRMEKDVMKMRAIPALDLPAGRPVVLEPGGYHIMLMDLKTQIKEGDKVPLTLEVQLRTGARETVEINAIARAPKAASAGSGHQGKGHSH